jgi:hypothetical protein
MYKAYRPIVAISVFKSGTWLIRQIIEDLTHLKMVEPETVDGFMDHGDPDYLFHRPGHFYSWHLVPTPAVQEKLRAMNALVVIILRNIYDLAVSMYYHFTDNIDWEIGRGANQDEFFKSIGKEHGLALVIGGSEEKGFSWPGMGYHLKQMQLMLEFSGVCQCCVLTFERLVQDRRSAVADLARYLNIEIDDERLSAIVEATSFKNMKEHNKRVGISSHFRKGQVFAHADDLNTRHVAILQQEMYKHAPKLDELVRIRGLDEIMKLEPCSLC